MELVSFCVVVEFIGLGCAGLLVMAASSNQNTLRNSRVRFIPYRRRAFSVPNISPVPEKPVFYTECLRKRIACPRRAFPVPSPHTEARGQWEKRVRKSRGHGETLCVE